MALLPISFYVFKFCPTKRMQSYARLVVLERVSYSKRIVYCKYKNNKNIFVYNHIYQYSFDLKQTLWVCDFAERIKKMFFPK
jgi:hypothetical protein